MSPLAADKKPRASEFGVLRLMYHRKPHLASCRIDRAWRVAVIDEHVVLTAPCSTRTDQYTSSWRHCCWGWSLWRWSVTMVTWNIRTKSCYAAFLNSKLLTVVDVWEVHQLNYHSEHLLMMTSLFLGLVTMAMTCHHGEIGIYLNRTSLCSWVQNPAQSVDIWELHL